MSNPYSFYEMRRASRKRRVINNAYVDVDCVTEHPGQDFQNWIEITKRKLQERESKLLTIIKTKIESIVNATLGETRLFIISDGIIQETYLVLASSINQWKGVNLARLKQPPTLYRDYYNVSKKSWDRRKTKLIGDALWVNVFKQIHQFVSMNTYRLIQILQALFSATIKYTNTKQQSLISGCIISNCKELQQYLITLHHSFRINEWIAEQKSNQVANAKSLQQMMRSHLDSIVHDQTVPNKNVTYVKRTSQKQNLNPNQSVAALAGVIPGFNRCLQTPIKKEVNGMLSHLQSVTPQGYRAVRGPSYPLYMNGQVQPLRQDPMNGARNIMIMMNQFPMNDGLHNSNRNTPPQGNAFGEGVVHAPVHDAWWNTNVNIPLIDLIKWIQPGALFNMI